MLFAISLMATASIRKSCGASAPGGGRPAIGQECTPEYVHLPYDGRLRALMYGQAKTTFPDNGDNSDAHDGIPRFQRKESRKKTQQYIADRRRTDATKVSNGRQLTVTSSSAAPRQFFIHALRNARTRLLKHIPYGVRRAVVTVTVQANCATMIWKWGLRCRIKETLPDLSEVAYNSLLAACEAGISV